MKRGMAESLIDFLTLVHEVRMLDIDVAEMLLSEDFFMHANNITLCGSIFGLFNWRSMHIPAKRFSDVYDTLCRDGKRGNQVGVKLDTEKKRIDTYRFIKLLQDMIKAGRGDAAKKVLERLPKVPETAKEVSELFSWADSPEGHLYWQEVDEEVILFRRRYEKEQGMSSMPSE